MLVFLRVLGRGGAAGALEKLGAGAALRFGISAQLSGLIIHLLLGGLFGVPYALCE